MIREVLKFFGHYNDVQNLSNISSKENGVSLTAFSVTETGLSIEIDAHVSSFIERKLSPIVKAKNGDTLEDSNRLVIGLAYLSAYFEDRDESVNMPLLMVDITDLKADIFKSCKIKGTYLVNILYEDIVIVNNDVRDFYCDSNKYLNDTLESFIPHTTPEIISTIYKNFSVKNDINTDEIIIKTGESENCFKLFSAQLDFKGKSELKGIRLEKSALVKEYIEACATTSGAVNLTNDVWYGTMTEKFPLGRGQAIVIQGNQQQDDLIIPVVGGPGTGKTTLFLSVIAQEITKRARDVINGVNRSNLMLVTSTSNKAIDNIANDLIKEYPSGMCYVGGNTENKRYSSDAVFELIEYFKNAEFNEIEFDKTIASVNRIKKFIDDRCELFVKLQELGVKSYADLVSIKDQIIIDKNKFFTQLFHSHDNSRLHVIENILLNDEKLIDTMLKFPSFGEYHRTNLFSLNYSMFKESKKLLNLFAQKHSDEVVKALSYLVADNKYEYMSENYGIKAEGVQTFLNWLSLGYPVVTSTLASVGSMFPGIFPDKISPYELLLVDEAGMISSKDIMPALRRSKRSIIVGDPKQLSPIVNMEPAFMDTLKNEYPANFWEQYSPAKVSAFHRAAGTLTGSKHEIGRGIILDEHRRCAPKIANLFIKVADYTGINVCTAKHDDQPFMNIGAEELMFFDIENHDKTSFSKSNLAEAVVIQRLLTRLEAAGYNLKTDVGIITPYKDQEAVLVREFGSLLGETDKMKKIGTIHKFQGVEFKVVIFSTVISRPKDSISFLNQMDMINVAISRAKQCFMVVGDFNKLTMNPGPDNIIGMVASHINSHGKYVSMKKKGE